MTTLSAREIYKLRQQIVEPAIGDIKENKGLRTFLTRRIEAVRTEFNLVCTAVNLGKIWRYLKGKGKHPEEGGHSLAQKAFSQDTMDSKVGFSIDLAFVT